MLLIWLIQVCSALDDINCALVSCDSETDSQYCLLYNNSTEDNSVFLNYPKCDTDCSYEKLYLVNDTWGNVKCRDYNETLRLPTGAFCSLAQNCSSNICSVPRCYGVPEGDYCRDDGGCMPFYHCENNVCTESYQEGDSCEIDNQCPPGHGCDKGECTLFFLKSIGESSDDGKFCKSNYAINGYCDSLLINRTGVELDSPFFCKIEETCDYISKRNGELLFSRPCACAGVKYKGGGYCTFELEHADKIVNEQYIYMTYTYSNCSGDYSHTDDPRILYQCGSISEDQFNFFWNLRGRARYWGFYQTGAINNCSVYFDLFDTVYDLDLYAFANSLNAVMFALIGASLI
ncbi:hypothetical protein SteCoe_4262 [Stentor coeruleus]|uniref:Dickkopf N-terminal cysteine-rich domain-containing protein n=1 Tax=Stentor coeruleus TaxID=5963 RepID=A0A1R2CVB9_9CILI|nr:hypothetical protein SteCoe_4262 [Stentor coeruleus]